MSRVSTSKRRAGGADSERHVSCSIYTDRQLWYRTISLISQVIVYHGYLDMHVITDKLELRKRPS